MRERDTVLLEKKKENRLSLSIEIAPYQAMFMYIRELSEQ